MDSLERDLDNCNDPTFLKHLKDPTFCSELYAALTNTAWNKIAHLTQEQLVAYKLKHDLDDTAWSCTFRYASGMIADLRARKVNEPGDYMDWYCSGPEGTVSDRIKQFFESLGWQQNLTYYED